MRVALDCIVPMPQRDKLKALDLFCGCGGISAGLRSAGFEVIAGVDIEAKYIATFRHNFRDARSLNADMTACSPDSLMSELGLAPGELDVIAGGPPCQGFSKNVPRKFRYIDDPNNLLIRTFLDYCLAIKPKMIIMENVAEMKNGFSRKFRDEIIAQLEKFGYSVTNTTLNAAEYGIPQRRRRAFFLAARESDCPAAPVPTHCQTSQQKGIFNEASFVTTWDAIGDLPSVGHGEGEDPCSYTCRPFSNYQKKARNGKRRVRNHVARHLAPTQYARLASLEPGQAHKDLPENLQIRGGYSGAYGRLRKDMVAPTITRWVFHPGSGRWGHPVDTRTLTIREIARIQGFPDNYEFVGSFVQQAGQLGNAVPPLLVEQIANSMRSQLGI